METQNNLTELRNQIDIIDKELAELLGKRITTVAKVAEAKKASGTPVLDKAREDAVAAKAVENSGINGFSEGIDNIFRNKSIRTALKIKIKLALRRPRRRAGE